MIITIYGILMSVVFILLVMGYWQDSSLFKMVGFIMLFLINLPVLSGGLEYKSGETQTYVNENVTIVEYDTTTYSDNTLSRLLCILGFVGASYLAYGEYGDWRKRRDDS